MPVFAFPAEHLIRRLRDHDNEIRSKATAIVVEIAMTDISALNVSSIEELTERIKDRRQAIRNEAMTGLCKLYGKYVVSLLPELEDNFSADVLVSVNLREKKSPGLEV